MLEFLMRVVLQLCVRCWVVLARNRAQRLAVLQAHLNLECAHLLRIRTSDDKLSLGILFADQRISYAGADRAQSDKSACMPVKTLQVELSELSVAVKLLRLRGDPSALTRAMQNGELKLSGDLNCLPWFVRLGKLMHTGRASRTQ